MKTVLPRLGEMLRALSGWRRLTASFAAGAFSALAFAPLGFFPALLLGYGVLVVLLDGATAGSARLRGAAWTGWAFGFGQFLIGMHWIGYPFLVDAADHGWQMPFAVLFMSGGLALFPCLACVIAAIFWRGGIARLLLFTASLAASEWLRGHIFTGLPWNLAAYGWGASLSILQSTSIIGVYGLTLLTILFGASLTELLAPRIRWRLPGIMLLLFAVMWIGGALRLAANPTDYVSGVRLRIVQPNIPENEKGAAQYSVRNWQRLVGLSQSPGSQVPTHIIWPEAAAPYEIFHSRAGLQQIDALNGSSGVLLTGAVRVERENVGTTRFFNSLYVLSAVSANVYDKAHLVPFGEYLPFASMMNGLGITKLTPGEVGFSPGPGLRTLNIPHAPPAGPLICYEVIFPGAVAGSPRPEWFVNVTNDAWFGPWAGPAQHFLNARVRAIEEGIPVVRAANTGISAVIDGAGRIVTTLSLNQTGVLDSELPKVLPLTPYGRYGDLGFLLLLLLCAVGTRLQVRRK